MNLACVHTCNLSNSKNEGHPGLYATLSWKERGENQVLERLFSVKEHLLLLQKTPWCLSTLTSHKMTLPSSFISCVHHHQDGTDSRGLWNAWAASCRPILFWNQEQTPQVSTCCVNGRVLWWGILFPIYVTVSWEWWKAFITLLMKNTLVSESNTQTYICPDEHMQILNQLIDSLYPREKTDIHQMTFVKRQHDFDQN